MTDRNTLLLLQAIGFATRSILWAVRAEGAEKNLPSIGRGPITQEGGPTTLTPDQCREYCRGISNNHLTRLQECIDVLQDPEG